jgi:ABC-type Zn uptake system ZnuABC Zn-binding protein ZnuA
MKMNRIVLLATALLSAAAAHAKLNVVATLPDFGSIAEEIGEDNIKVTVIARGTEDPHFVDARPSFIRVLNQADVLLESGAELELGWLPPLVNNARNAKILPGGKGHLLMSRGISLLEVPTGPIDRSMGDVHPAGNPHYWLDPANGKIMAATLAEAFSRLDPANADTYQGNLRRFNERLDKRLAEWTRSMAPLRGKKVVTYHKSFDYLLKRFGLELSGTIEPRPGIEPSPTHINALVGRMKEESAALLMIEPYRPRRTPEYVAKSTGVPLLLLPEKVGGHEKAKDYLSLFDYNVSQITSALK